jgi:transposase
MKDKQKQYGAEFKEGAVRLWEESGREATAIAADLGIRVEYLYRWRRAKARASQSGEQAFPGQGRPRDEELAALKKENQILRQEREILKKALGLFTPTPR